MSPTRGLFTPRRGEGAEDNYRLLVQVLVERLGGHVIVTTEELAGLVHSNKQLFTTHTDNSVTFEVVPDAQPGAD